MDMPNNSRSQRLTINRTFTSLERHRRCAAVELPCAPTEYGGAERAVPHSRAPGGASAAGDDGAKPAVTVYNVCYQPNIAYCRRCRGQRGWVIEAQDVSQVQVDIAAYCNAVQEALAVRCSLDRCHLLLVSHYG